jgi:BirA family transcriptional regulator, biotin operon repressor / biotin---[acetyl-CoA-carboxylase] ligase
MSNGSTLRAPLDFQLLRRELGIDVQVYAELGSTNAEARTLAADRAEHPLVVVAEHQSAGRGRRDRRWEAPARAALTFSLVLRPQVAADYWPWLPLLSGYAVVRVLRTRGVHAALKWPNDVLVGDRKIAGILVERVDTSRGPAAVIGIGLNVSLTVTELPVPTATSLLLVTGADWDRTDLLVGLVRALRAEYAEWELEPATASAALRTAYLGVCDTLNRQVRAELPGGRSVTGTAIDIDHVGRLVIGNATGSYAIGAGDVVHIRPTE